MILPRQSPLWESVLGGDCPWASPADCHSSPSPSPRSPAVDKTGKSKVWKSLRYTLGAPVKLETWMRQADSNNLGLSNESHHKTTQRTESHQTVSFTCSIMSPGGPELKKSPKQRQLVGVCLWNKCLCLILFCPLWMWCHYVSHYAFNFPFDGTTISWVEVE